MVLRCIIFIVFFSICIVSKVWCVADIVWANSVIKSTQKYEDEENHAQMALGVPAVYLGIINEKIDPFSDGYILHYDKNIKRNIIKFGFPRVVGAEQLILGGIFNLGTIASVKIIDINNQEVEVYSMIKGSVSKFHNFNIFFEPRSVKAVKIEFDHSKINQWNLIKGIGLVDNTEPVHPYPNFYTEDEFYGKEQVAFTHENEGCYTLAPKISSDGNTLFFVEHCPDNVDDDQDIWISTKDSTNKWGKSIKAGWPLNNKGHNFVASIGEKERFLLLGNNYTTDGEFAGDGISISYRKEDGTWTIPTNISIPGLHNLNEHANFHLNASEDILLMSIQDSSSIGQLDLYVCFKNKATGGWSKPINLGPNINTFLSEDSPCLLGDNKTLFFSSNGYIGFGRHDLYVTTRLDDSWQRWSEPLNLGPLVNSKSDDYGFSISSDGRHAYYNSLNILDSNIITEIYHINLPKSFFQEAKIQISGVVRSETDSSGVDALISIQNESGTIQSFYNSAGLQGKYTIAMPIFDQYYITIENDNFYHKEVVHSLAYINSVTGLGGSIDFYIKPLPKSGYSFNLQNIYFIRGTANLSTISGSTLDSLVVELKRDPRSIIEIEGHLEVEDGKKIKNIGLLRAKAVGNYLVNRGISESRIKYKENKDVLDNADDGPDKVSITYVGRKGRMNQALSP